MNEFINKIGVDKILHFSVGGLITALMTIMVVFQEGQESFNPGMLIASPIIGTLIVFVLSFMKEAIIDSKFDWKDIIASVLGAVPVFMAVALGVLFNVLSK